jgi:hypothetical protein
VQQQLHPQAKQKTMAPDIYQEITDQIVQNWKQAYARGISRGAPPTSSHCRYAITGCRIAV